MFYLSINSKEFSIVGWRTRPRTSIKEYAVFNGSTNDWKVASDIKITKHGRCVLERFLEQYDMHISSNQQFIKKTFEPVKTEQTQTSTNEPKVDFFSWLDTPNTTQTTNTLIKTFELPEDVKPKKKNSLNFILI